jgi:hypothetical protein
MSGDPVVRSAGRWFWWIAGLSLVNTVLFFSGSDINFVLGLGMTALTNSMFAGSLTVAVALAALGIGFYFFIGLLAQREQAWAFYLGLVVYALDALIYLRFQDWLPVAFHAYAIFAIFKGVARLRGRSAPALAQ